MEKAPPPRKFPIVTVIILLLFLSGFTLVNYLILAYTHYFYHDDHLLRSLGCFNSLKRLDFSQFFLVDQLYPPFMHQVSALLFFMLPPTMINVGLTQFPFWVVLAFSIYGIARRLFSPLTGYLAVFYFFTSPLTLWWSYQYMLDIPAAGMLTLSFYLLLKSENFSNRLYACLFGIALGLGLLTKWSVFFLLLPVLLYYLFSLYPAYLKDIWSRVLGLAVLGGLFYLFVKLAYGFPFACGWLTGWGEGLVLWLSVRGVFWLAQKWGRVEKPNFPPLSNFLDSLTITFLLCAWLYLNPRFSLLSGLLFETARMGDIPWPGLWYYPAYLLHDALRMGYLPFLLIGISAFLLTCWKKPQQRLLLFTLAGAFFMLEIIPNKQESRYLLPWLALASPVAVFWIDYLKKLKILPIIYLLLIGLLYGFSIWSPMVWKYKESPAPAFFLRGEPALTERTPGVWLDLQRLKEFLKPLPNKGEGVGVLNLTNEASLGGSSFIIIPSYLIGYRLDQVHSSALEDYQYLLSVVFYAEKPENLKKKIQQKKPEMKGVEKYSFLPLSRYPFPDAGFDLVLAKLVKENNSR